MQVSTLVSTTRGMPFSPDLARRRREIDRQIREAQTDQAYREHFTGQARYAKAAAQGRENRNWNRKGRR